jgi:hypothetical protein
MKMFPVTGVTRGLLPAVVAMLMFLTGCASRKIDWAGRVGNYTYDQAILELGPPDKHATLADGTIVADWLTRRGYVYMAPAFGYTPWAYYGPYYPTYVDTYTPDYFLRLVFGPEGKLQSWRRLAR